MSFLLRGGVQGPQLANPSFRLSAARSPALLHSQARVWPGRLEPCIARRMLSISRQTASGELDHFDASAAPAPAPVPTAVQAASPSEEDGPKPATPGAVDPSSSREVKKQRAVGKDGKRKRLPYPIQLDTLRFLPGMTDHLMRRLQALNIKTASALKCIYDEDVHGFDTFLEETLRMRHPRHRTSIMRFFETTDIMNGMGALGPKVTLSVEGNIGAGKSTFLNILKRSLAEEKGINYVKEPVEKWQAVGSDAASGTSGFNLLDLFYKEPERTAYLFQSYVFFSRVEQERATYASSQHARLLERSIFSDRMVFVRALHADQLLKDHEVTIYDAWFGPLLETLPTLIPNGFIYLRASPETCMARLRKRARSEETGISLEYLTNLHSKHEDWLHQAATLAVELKPLADKQAVLVRQLQKQMRRQAQAQLAAQQAEAQQQQQEQQPPPPPQGQEASPSSSSASGAAAEGAAGAAASSSTSGRLHELLRGVPLGLHKVNIPPSLEGSLYFLDSTKISGVRSSPFLHQQPALVIDYDEDVDVDNDHEYGRRIGQMVEDYTTFAAEYRKARTEAANELAAAARCVRYGANMVLSPGGGVLLPAGHTDYYSRDKAGRVRYKHKARAGQLDGILPLPFPKPQSQPAGPAAAAVAVVAAADGEAAAAQPATPMLESSSGKGATPKLQARPRRHQQAAAISATPN